MVEVEKGVLEKLILFSIAITLIPLGLLYATLHGYLDRECPQALVGLLGYMHARSTHKHRPCCTHPHSVVMQD